MGEPTTEQYALTGYKVQNRYAVRQNVKSLTQRVLLAFGIALFAGLAATSTASAETRSLKLYYIHTKEKKTITFKRNGKYLSSGLKEVNRFLRDWRRNEPTKMDPKLLDLVWEAYKMSGAREHIHVVSAYRSPATNEMLRKTRGGQAKKSQHTLGRAMDFYIPGVKVKKLREIGFKLGGGGVGYYPRSGVPFVHLDTGNVRAWPRMSRSELKRLFPKGNTAHLPTDGKPLPGYKQALAKYEARKRGKSVTVSGGGSKSTSKSSSGGGGNLLAKLFGGGRDEEEDKAETVVAAAPAARKRAPKAAPPPPTPGVVLAALPARALPVPTQSPRARSVAESVPVPVTVAAALAPATQPVLPAATPEPPVEIASAPAAPTYEIPVPSRRPAVLIARAESPIDRRSAQELERALAASAQPAEQNVQVATAPVPDGNDAIIAVLNADDTVAVQTASTELAYALPIPQAAPLRQETTALASAVPTPEPIVAEGAVETPSIVAYAPPQRSLTDSDVPRIQPMTRPAAAASPAGKSGRVAITDNTLTGALVPQISTTPKDPRPTVADNLAVAAAPKPSIVPVDEIDQSRFGTWTTTNQSIAENGRVSETPDFIQNATRSVPNVVYTAGFSAAPPQSTDSFSGNAVTFLAFAKFENGVGDDGEGRGEPLQLSVPN